MMNLLFFVTLLFLPNGNLEVEAWSKAHVAVCSQIGGVSLIEQGKFTISIHCMEKPPEKEEEKEIEL